MVKRVVVGAHYGLRDWLAQRATAVIMAIYLAVFGLLLLALRPDSYEAWRGLFVLPGMRLASSVFFGALFYHAWVGVRDIVMDYVQPTLVRLVLEVAVITCLFAYGVWALQILWSI